MDFDWDEELIETQHKKPEEDPPEEDGWEYVDELIDDETDDSTVTLAIKRIEQAKLYESLITHDFFAPGSARPEIQSKVTKEIRDFILDRLSVLVGLKDEPSTVQVKAEMPWNESQIEALTSIANRLVDKKSTTVLNKPTVQQFSAVSSSVPVVNVVNQSPVQPKQAEVDYQPVQKRTKRTKRTRRRKAEAKVKLPSGVKIDDNTGRPMSENGIVLYGGQVTNKSSPPKKMPTQAEMNMINNRAVQRNQAGTGSIGDKLLGMAINQAQSLNRNILEE